MLKRLSMLLLSCALVLAADFARAAGWSDSFTASKNNADQSGRPLVAVLGRKDCQHCNALTVAMRSATFEGWSRRGDFDICFIELGDPQNLNSDQQAAKAFCYDNWVGSTVRPNEFPYVALYRKTGDFSEKVNFSGQSGLMLAGTSADPLANQLMASIQKFFWGDKFGATITCGQSDGDRLEAEPSTIAVPIPLARDSASLSKAVTLKLVAAKGSVSKEYQVLWNVGCRETFLWLPMADFKSVFSVGGCVSLSVYDSEEKLCDENRVFMVDAQPNSVVNPKWIGEPFSAGEWTMDLDAATNAAALAQGHTIVYFTGALWCPHCQALEEGVFSTPEFAAWTLKNGVKLVELDNPRRSSSTVAEDLKIKEPIGAPPTLLRYAAGTNSFPRAACAMPSGASYLSRKSISNELAEAVLQRNRTLGYPGGTYCAPGPNRTGYPTLILLNAAGKPVGRLKYLEEKSGNVCDTAENMRRLDELLKLADRPDESSDYAETTTAEYALGGDLQVPFQVNDTKEFLVLAGLRYGRCRFDVARSNGADVVLEYIRDGVSVAVGTNALEFLCGTADLAATRPLLKLSTDSTESFTATLGSSRTQVEGNIRFARQSIKVVEPGSTVGSTNVAIEVVRENGDKGAVSVRMVLTGADGRVTFAQDRLTWADGEAGVKSRNLTIADNETKDGDLELTLTLTKVSGDDAVSSDPLSVRVIDDDIWNVPGVLAITGAGDGFSGHRSVIAQAGETVAFTVARETGRLGSPKAHLELAVDGEVVAKSEDMSWEEYSADNVRTVSLKMPECASACLATATLCSESPNVDPARNSVTVQVLVGDLPRFPVGQLNRTVYPGFSVSESLPVTTVGGGTPGMVKMLGSLPPGVQARFEGGALTVSGVVRVPGRYSLACRAKETDGSETITYGRSINLNYLVPDVTAADDEEDGGPTGEGAAIPGGGGGKPALPNVFIGRSFNAIDLPMGDGERFTGLLTVSATSLGHLSAVYRTIDGGRFAFVADGWSDLDGDGTMEVRLRGVNGRFENVGLDISVFSDNLVVASCMDSALGTVISGTAEALPWNKDNAAAPWIGTYTVQLPHTNDTASANCTGPAFMTVRVTSESARSGVALYAGMLPDGQAFSGIAELKRQSDNRAWMPFLVRTDGSKPAVFGGVLEIDADAARTYKEQRFCVRSPATLGVRWVRGDGDVVEHQVYGGYYDGTELADNFKSDYAQDAAVVFAVDPSGRCLPETVPTAVVSVSPANVPMAARGNALGLCLSLNRENGIVSGSFKAGGRDFGFRGVILSGWGQPDCGGDCGFVETAERPFLSGSCFEQTDGDGRICCGITIHRAGSKLE